MVCFSVARAERHHVRVKEKLGKSPHLPLNCPQFVELSRCSRFVLVDDHGLLAHEVHSPACQAVDVQECFVWVLPESVHGVVERPVDFFEGWIEEEVGVFWAVELVALHRPEKRFAVVVATVVEVWFELNHLTFFVFLKDGVILIGGKTDDFDEVSVEERSLSLFKLISFIHKCLSHL